MLHIIMLVFSKNDNRIKNFSIRNIDQFIQKHQNPVTNLSAFDINIAIEINSKTNSSLIRFLHASQSTEV